MDSSFRYPSYYRDLLISERRFVSNFLLIYKVNMPVTKDQFRAEQKKMCKSGAPNKVGIYGCSCCRMTGNLNKFKKESRDIAKTRFNRSTKDEIAQALSEMPAELADKEHVMYSEEYEYDPRDFNSPGDYYTDPMNDGFLQQDEDYHYDDSYNDYHDDY